jgi:5S rRNA maturation endonuclease (ribonuclease M5)
MGMAKGNGGKNRTLVIVESPAKARTIGRYLGTNFDVAASVGHVRDLPPKDLGVDVENGFEPHYVTIRGKAKVLQELKRKARNAESVILATDPDREGEAIAFHVADHLGMEKEPGRFLRVEFREITKAAVARALESPGRLDMRKVEAQQARRILDRLVGYQVSPFLWKPIRPGLSAGRVQTVALRLICEREDEIQAFVAEEYWSITAHLLKDEQGFEAKLHQIGGPSHSSWGTKPRPMKCSGTSRGFPSWQRRSSEGNAGRIHPPLHHLHPATGGRQETPLLGPQDDGFGPATLRGGGDRRSRPGRTDHVHADRLHPRLGGRRTGGEDVGGGGVR